MLTTSNGSVNVHVLFVISFPREVIHYQNTAYIMMDNFTSQFLEESLLFLICYFILIFVASVVKLVWLFQVEGSRRWNVSKVCLITCSIMQFPTTFGCR